VCQFLGELGVTYTVHLWLVEKRVIDFLLVLIELFRQLLWLRRYEQILVEIVLFERAKFQVKGESSTNEFWRQKTRVPGLFRGVDCLIRHGLKVRSHRMRRVESCCGAALRRAAQQRNTSGVTEP